jgi:2-polyprenyl-3-methyl-5-hydroxy-6-metoxy-1,4-benzoquinol methylase
VSAQRFYSGEFWERIIDDAFENGVPERWQKSIFEDEHPLVDAFVEQLPVGALVLDFGCGLGRNALPLARRGFRVSACDVAEAGPRLTAERGSEEGLTIDAVACDGVSIAMGDGSVDGILAWSVLDHVTLADATSLAQEFARIARAGALLLVSIDEDKSKDPESVAEVLPDGTHRYTGGRREGMLFRPYTNEEILGLFAEGWERLSFEGADTTVHRRGLFRRIR